MESQINPPPKQIDNFISVKQYADLKNVSVQAVYGKINRNTVEIKKIGNIILVKDI